MKKTSLTLTQALSLAKSLSARGEIAHARKIYQSILARIPEHGEAKTRLAALNNRHEREKADRGASHASDRVFEFYKSGKTEEALELALTLENTEADTPLLRNLMGACQAAKNDYTAASASFQKAIEIDPQFAGSYNNFGNVLRQQGNYKDAIQYYKKALSLNSGSAEFINNLGGALKESGDLDGAISIFEKAIETKPDYAEACNNLGTALVDKSDFTGAISCFQKAIRLKPNYHEAYNNLSNVQKEQGKTEAAVASLEQALDIYQDYPQALYNLSLIRNLDENRIKRIKDTLESDSLAAQSKIFLSFALAQTFDKRSQFDEAFYYFQKANEYCRKRLPYDIDDDEKTFHRIKQAFSCLTAQEKNQANNISLQNGNVIFIVGMPRSGTTLVEQILASHSQVYGAGELMALTTHAFPALQKIPEACSEKQLTEASRTILKSYHDDLSVFQRKGRIITDKMPHNFIWAGFVLLAFPEAKVINVNRDPRAVCWSIYRHYFQTRGIRYTNDLEDIAAFFNFYQNLMNFWNDKFSGKIYNLQYESLTENQETETRKLLEYCGLGWEEQCLDFHTSQRVVKTASSLQVRKEMYRGSSSAWRNYEKHLGPMLQALGYSSRDSN